MLDCYFKSNKFSINKIIGIFLVLIGLVLILNFKLEDSNDTYNKDNNTTLFTCKKCS